MLFQYPPGKPKTMYDLNTTHLLTLQDENFNDRTKYIIKKELGTGAFGKVYVAHEVNTSENKVAIKIPKKKYLSMIFVCIYSPL